VVEVEALDRAQEENGWTVLATTGGAERCSDAEILQAYQEQHTSVEPGFRWSKNPAAISPVWRETPERIAALAMLSVVGLLVDAVMQWQVRLSLRTHDQHVPGNKGETTMPTAAVVLSLFAPVAVVQIQGGHTAVRQMYGVHPHHLHDL
jgi:transposase